MKIIPLHTTLHRYFRVTAFLFTISMMSTQIQAASSTWTAISGGTVQQTTSTTTNWNNGVAGVNSGTVNTDTATFNNVGYQNINVGGTYNLQGISFGTVGSSPNVFLFNAGNFNLTNNAVIQTDNTFSGIAGFITGPVTINGTNSNLTLLANGKYGSSLLFSSINTATGLGTATLTLDGSNYSYGNGVYGSILANTISQGTGTTLNVVKNGSGTWAIQGTNTYTGSTTLNAGTVIVQNVSAFGTTGNIIVAGNVTLRGATALNDPGTRLVLNDGATLTYDTYGVNTTWSAAWSTGSAGTGGLTKMGIGQLALTLSNGQTQSYKGDTTVNMGTLVISATNQTANWSNLISNQSRLVLGGGVVNVTGKATFSGSQTFNGTVINSGISQIIPAASTGTNTVSLGAITRNNGGLLNIVSAGNYSFNSTSANNTNGFYKGLLFNGDFATINNSTGVISGGTYATNNTANTWTSGSGSYVTGGTVTGVTGTGGTIDINALKLNAAASNSFTINGTLRTALGITFGSGIGTNASLISGGNITSSNGDLLIVNANAQNFYGRNTISSTITDNGTTPVDVVFYNAAGSANSALFISGTNTYTGNTYIAAGSNNQGFSNLVVIGGSGATGARIGSTNATVYINGGTTAQGTIGNNGGLRIGNGDATGDVLGTIAVENGRLSLNRTDTYTVSAQVTGTSGGGYITQDSTGSATINLKTGTNSFFLLANQGAGTLVLNGAGTINSFIGQNWAGGFATGATTTLNSGIYYFTGAGNSGANALGTFNINGASITLGGGRYWMSGGGTLNLNSGSLTFQGSPITNEQQGTGNIVWNISGGLLDVPQSANNGSFSWQVGSNATATGTYTVNQSGGTVQLGFQDNSANLQSVSTGLGIGGSTVGRVANYNLSGGTLRVNSTIGAISTNSIGGTGYLNWTGGTITANTINTNSLGSNDAINTSTGGILYQGGSTSVLAPGDTFNGQLYTGRTTINGNYQLDGGSIAIGLSGTAAATQFHSTPVGTYDNVLVNGAATLGTAGDLLVTLNNGFIPTGTNTTFTILTATGGRSGVLGGAHLQTVTGGQRVIATDGLSSFTTTTSGSLVLGGYVRNEWAGNGNAWGFGGDGAWTAMDPNSAAYIASFGDYGIAGQAVTLDDNRTVAGLILTSGTSGASYAISNASGSTSIGETLTLSNPFAIANGGSSASNTVINSTGTHAVNVPIVLSSNLETRVNSGVLGIGGDISGAGLGLTKTGSGRLDLSGANTYTGATIVNAGEFRNNGSLASALTTAATGAPVISGTGSFSGLVTINATTILAPGANPSGNLGSVGTLTFSNGLTINSGAGLTYDSGDLIRVSGGTLTLGSTNISLTLDNGVTLGTGTYTLFNYNGATLSGGITGLTLTNPLGTGVNAVFNNTGTAITLVLSSGPTNPASGSLTINAPARVIAGSTVTVTGTLGNTASAPASDLNVAVLSIGTTTVNSLSSGAATVVRGSSTAVSGSFLAGAAGSSYSVQLTNTDGSANPINADSNIVTGIAVGNRVVSATAVDLGRQIAGANLGSRSGTTTLTSTGGDSANTRVTVGGILFNGTTTTGTATATGSIASVANTGTLTTLTTTGEGLLGESANNVTVGYTATPVNNRVVTATAVDLGRQFAGANIGSQSGTTTLTSTGADSAFTRVTVGGTLFNGTTTTGTTTATGTVTSVASSGTLTTLTTTGEGLLGENKINVNVGYTATAVNARTISTSTVSLGKVLVGTAITGTSTLSTTGADTAFTRVTVNGTAATDSSGATVNAGSNQLFNSASSSTTRTLTGNFSTSGSKSGSVGLSVSGEGLTGESVNTVNVAYTATAYDAANVSSSQTGNNLTLSNASGAFRAAAAVMSKTLTGDSGWSVSGFDVGTQIAAGSQATATGSFNATGKLGGLTYTASLAIGLQHADQTIAGTSANDLGSKNFNFSQTLAVNNTSSTANATIADGTSYNGIGLKNNAGFGTQATLLGGSATGSTNLIFTFIGQGGASDRLDLTTPGSFVLQLSYDKISAQALAGGETQAFLAWLNNGAYANAISGNTANTSYALSKYAGSYASFLSSIGADGSNLALIMGAWGIDTSNSTVWAVLNHNSEFVVVPEPSTYGLFLGGLILLVLVLRRRSQGVV